MHASMSTPQQVHTPWHGTPHGRCTPWQVHTPWHGTPHGTCTPHGRCTPWHGTALISDGRTVHKTHHNRKPRLPMHKPQTFVIEGICQAGRNQGMPSAPCTHRCSATCVSRGMPSWTADSTRTHSTTWLAVGRSAGDVAQQRVMRSARPAEQRSGGGSSGRLALTTTWEGERGGGGGVRHNHLRVCMRWWVGGGGGRVGEDPPPVCTPACAGVGGREGGSTCVCTPACVRAYMRAHLHTCMHVWWRGDGGCGNYHRSRGNLKKPRS